MDSGNLLHFMNGAGPGSRYPTLAAKTKTRRGWGTHVLARSENSLPLDVELLGMQRGVALDQNVLAD